jgi:uncharacterized integral membrane protein
MNLFWDSEVKLILINILASNVFGILFVFAGYSHQNYFFNYRRIYKKTSNKHKKIKEQEKLAKYRLYIIIKKMK